MGVETSTALDQTKVVQDQRKGSYTLADWADAKGNMI